MDQCVAQWSQNLYKCIQHIITYRVRSLDFSKSCSYFSLFLRALKELQVIAVESVNVQRHSPAFSSAFSLCFLKTQTSVVTKSKDKV